MRGFVWERLHNVGCGLVLCVAFAPLWLPAGWLIVSALADSLSGPGMVETDHERRYESPKTGHRRMAVRDLWSCSYVPTMNRDWHDDVLCSNGFREARPYLLPRMNFVTEEQVMAAARRYEKRLNAHR